MRVLKEIIYDAQTYINPKGTHPRLHSKQLDKKFGYRIPKIEEKLNQKYRPYFLDNDKTNRKQHFKGAQTWIGLHPQVLQTPYSHILDCLQVIKNEEIDKIIDIGCGYGRVGLVMNAVFPKAQFLGYEILSKREAEGNRIYHELELRNCQIKSQNVLEDDFVLPKAQVYFIYDFSEADDIDRILETLSKRTGQYQFFLIVKGERVERLIQKKFKMFWSNRRSIRVNDFKIYRSM